MEYDPTELWAYQSTTTRAPTAQENANGFQTGDDADPDLFNYMFQEFQRKLYDSENHAVVRCTTGDALTTLTWNAVSFNQVDYDPEGLYVPASDGFVIPTAGANEPQITKARVTLSLALAIEASDSFFGMAYTLNGDPEPQFLAINTGYIEFDTGAPVASIQSVWFPVSPGDIIGAAVYPVSATKSLNVEGNIMQIQVMRD